jgi:hypothetical protein
MYINKITTIGVRKDACLTKIILIARKTERKPRPAHA